MFQALIATTEGTVEIEMISEESSGVLCCATEGLATTDELPLSRSYQKFVTRPTGVVGKLTGHESYRLCLSRSIDTGSSWQLPVYLAHWLKYHNQLYERLRPGKTVAPKAIIWATGEVNYHLQVESVGGLNHKLSHLVQWLQQNICKPIPILVVVPHDCVASAKAYLDKLLDSSFDIRIIGLKQVDTPEQIFDDLLLHPDNSASTSEKSGDTTLELEDKTKRHEHGGLLVHRVGIFLGLAAFFLLIGYTIFEGGSTQDPNHPPPRIIESSTIASLPDGAALEVFIEHRAGTESCFSMTETRTAFRESYQDIPHPIPAVLKIRTDESACRITLLIHNRGSTSLSGLLMPTEELLDSVNAEGALPIFTKEVRSAVLLDRTEPGGMSYITGSLMRLILAPTSTADLKGILDNKSTHGSALNSNLGTGLIWMRDVQAIVERAIKPTN
ncbi:MAG: hypothetical protein L3J26_09950 [Candidatus Polarisedimenticolaceae bacterium]|nr:hypothetical protein [Candidatus Polarisedimenticolaceae bacterium]